MKRMLTLWAILACGAVWVLGQGAPVSTQPMGPEIEPLVPTTQAAATQATGTRPVDERYRARVIEVEGRVGYALVDAGGELGPWQSAKVGTELPAGARIRTGLRSKIIMAFGDDTVVEIDRATLASIDQFHRSADTKVIRLGLGHGAVRAGVAETTLRSDMTIETPTATLSKRGTMGFSMTYEPVAGRFRIALADEGLVEALNKITDDMRSVRPGEHVTQAMRRWIETARFNRYVPVATYFGLTDSEQNYMVGSGGEGRAVASPGEGGNSNNTTSWDSKSIQRIQRPGYRPMTPIDFGDGVIDRPEGNFGTGR